MNGEAAFFEGLLLLAVGLPLAAQQPPPSPQPQPQPTTTSINRGDRNASIGLTGIAALAAFLLDYLGRIWDPARALSRLSPFHFWEPMALLSGAGLTAKNVIVLLAIGVVGTAISYGGFARRDL